jgi:cytochrome P450 family 6
MKMMFSTISNLGDNLLEYVDEYATTGNVMDGKDIFVRFTCDVISSCAFGLETMALKEKDCEILKISDKIFKMSAWRSLHFLMISQFRDVAKKLRMTQTPKDVQTYFMKVLKDIVTHREKTNSTRHDFLHLLLQLKNVGYVTQETEDIVEESSKTDRKLTFDELAGTAFLFFFAGFETSSTTMSYAMYELAANPEIQERARKEVTTIMSEHGGCVTYAAVMEMKYLHQVMNGIVRKKLQLFYK